MENFLFALNTVLPFLLYIAFGYGVRMSGLADEDFMKRLNKVIFQAFFPILMFNNLYSIPEGMTLNLRLVAVAIISVLLLQAVLHALAHEKDMTGLRVLVSGAALSSRRFTAAISSCSAFRWQPACLVRREHCWRR